MKSTREHQNLLDDRVEMSIKFSIIGGIEYDGEIKRTQNWLYKKMLTQYKFSRVIKEIHFSFLLIK